MFVTGRRVQGGEARRENLLELGEGVNHQSLSTCVKVEMKKSRLPRRPRRPNSFHAGLSYVTSKRTNAHSASWTVELRELEALPFFDTIQTPGTAVLVPTTARKHARDGARSNK